MFVWIDWDHYHCYCWYKTRCSSSELRKRNEDDAYKTLYRNDRFRDEILDHREDGWDTTCFKGEIRPCVIQTLSMKWNEAIGCEVGQFNIIHIIFIEWIVVSFFIDQFQLFSLIFLDWSQWIVHDKYKMNNLPFIVE